MAIRRLRVSNFRSFDKVDVSFGDFTLIVGANASGKSNLVEVFRFLRDISRYGLSNAVSIQGGVEYIRNLGTVNSQELSVAVEVEVKDDVIALKRDSKRLVGIRTKEIIYEFCMRFPGRRKDFFVDSDRITLRCEFFNEPATRPSALRDAKSVGNGDIVLEIEKENKNRKPRLIVPEGVGFGKEDILPPFFTGIKLTDKQLLIETPLTAFLLMGPRMFTDISIFDIDTRQPKRASPVTGRTDLEENGANLAVVLNSIIENPKKKRRLSNLIHDLLPFAEDLKVVRSYDRSLVFTLRETYNKGKYLPAFLLSDGTITLTALVVALYFQDRSTMIFEEPERNIHPQLMPRVMNMFKEASKKKQIIVTTHNPEMVRHAELNDILLISRTSDGASRVVKPSESETVKAFLDSELGVSDLFVDGLLGV